MPRRSPTPRARRWSRPAAPLVYSVFLLFVRWDFMNAPKWVGLENFQKLAADDLVRTSLYATSYYTFLAVPLQIVVALALALALDRPLRGIGLFRAIFYI